LIWSNRIEKLEIIKKTMELILVILELSRCVIFKNNCEMMNGLLNRLRDNNVLIICNILIYADLVN